MTKQTYTETLEPLYREAQADGARGVNRALWASWADADAALVREALGKEPSVATLRAIRRIGQDCLCAWDKARAGKEAENAAKTDD